MTAIPDDDRRLAQVRRALAELRFLPPDQLASALLDYEPEVAAAAQLQLLAEEAAFARLLSLTGAAYDLALAELDEMTAAGVRLRREALANGDPLLGTVDHDFKLVRVLGTGGGGRVYLVERQSYPQTMALKVMAGWDQAAKRRFDRERAVLARMHHPFIVQLADAWERPDGHSALLMELVEGQSITAFADERRLGIDARLELVEHVCRAVEYAHQLGVLHRDLKPGNIMVTPGGMPKVLDFGIAKVTGDAQQTKTVGFFGTFAYASPEQLGRREIDGRTDVYALGVILCELLVDTRPHEGEVERLADPDRPAAAAAVLFRGLSVEEAEKVAAQRGLGRRELAQRLRGDLGVVVQKALHHEVERRYGSVSELATDLAAVRRGLPVAARGDSLWYGLRRLAARNRAATAFAALLMATLVTFGVREHFREARASRLANVLAEDIGAVLRDVKELPDLPSRVLRESRKGLLRAVEARLDKLLAELEQAQLADVHRLRIDAQLLQAEIAEEIGDGAVARQRARAAFELAQSLRELPAAQVSPGYVDRVAARALQLQADTIGDSDAKERRRLYDEALASIEVAFAAAPDDIEVRVLRLTIQEHRLNHRRLVDGGDTTTAGWQQWITDAAALQPWAGTHPRADFLLLMGLVREGELLRDSGSVKNALPLFQRAAARITEWPVERFDCDLLRLRMRVCRTLGDVHLMLGQEPESASWFQSSLDYAEAYLRDDPEDVAVLVSYSRSLYYVGQAQRQQRDPRARATYEHMLAVRRGLHERDQQNQSWLREFVLGEFAMADFEGTQLDDAARLRHLVEAARLADQLVVLTKTVGYDLETAAMIHEQVAALRQSAGDEAGAKLAAERSETLYEMCLLHAPAMEPKVRPALESVRELLVPAGDLHDLRERKQLAVDAARPGPAAALTDLHRFGGALHSLAVVSTNLEDWPAAVTQWHEACAVWQRITELSSDPVYRPAYRDILLRTCECHVKSGTLAQHADFLQQAMAFCAEWRDDSKIAPRLTAIEAAARSSGLATDAVDAIFRRVK